jgi:hypothetical protein
MADSGESGQDKAGLVSNRPVPAAALSAPDITIGSTHHTTMGLTTSNVNNPSTLGMESREMQSTTVTATQGRVFSEATPLSTIETGGIQDVATPIAAGILDGAAPGEQTKSSAAVDGNASRLEQAVQGDATAIDFGAHHRKSIMWFENEAETFLDRCKLVVIMPLLRASIQNDGWDGLEHRWDGLEVYQMRGALGLEKEQCFPWEGELAWLTDITQPPAESGELRAWQQMRQYMAGMMVDCDRRRSLVEEVDLAFQRLAGIRSRLSQQVRIYVQLKGLADGEGSRSARDLLDGQDKHCFDILCEQDDCESNMMVRLEEVADLSAIDYDYGRCTWHPGSGLAPSGAPVSLPGSPPNEEDGDEDGPNDGALSEEPAVQELSAEAQTAAVAKAIAEAEASAAAAEAAAAALAEGSGNETPQGGASSSAASARTATTDKGKSPAPQLDGRTFDSEAFAAEIRRQVLEEEAVRRSYSAGGHARKGYDADFAPTPQAETRADGDNPVEILHDLFRGQEEAELRRQARLEEEKKAAAEVVSIVEGAGENRDAVLRVARAVCDGDGDMLAAVRAVDSWIKAHPTLRILDYDKISAEVVVAVRRDKGVARNPGALMDIWELEVRRERGQLGAETPVDAPTSASSVEEVVQQLFARGGGGSPSQSPTRSISNAAIADHLYSMAKAIAESGATDAALTLPLSVAESDSGAAGGGPDHAASSSGGGGKVPELRAGQKRGAAAADAVPEETDDTRKRQELGLPGKSPVWFGAKAPLGRQSELVKGTPDTYDVVVDAAMRQEDAARRRKQTTTAPLTQGALVELLNQTKHMFAARRGDMQQLLLEQFLFHLLSGVAEMAAYRKLIQEVMVAVRAVSKLKPALARIEIEAQKQRPTGDTLLAILNIIDGELLPERDSTNEDLIMLSWHHSDAGQPRTAASFLDRIQALVHLQMLSPEEIEEKVLTHFRMGVVRARGLRHQLVAELTTGLTLPDQVYEKFCGSEAASLSVSELSTQLHKEGSLGRWALKARETRRQPPPREAPRSFQAEDEEGDEELDDATRQLADTKAEASEGQSDADVACGAV